MRPLTAPLALCFGGLALAQTGLQINQGWGKVRTMEDVCRDTPEAYICRARELGINGPRPLRAVAPRVVYEQSYAPAAANGRRRDTVRFTGVPVQLPAGRARLRFFHSGAALAAGVNIKAWRDSGGLNTVADQLKAAGLPAGIQPAAILPLIGELDQLWVVVDGPGPRAASANTTAKDPEPVLLVTGSFTNPIWQQMLTGGESLDGATAVLIGKPAAVAAMQRRLRVAAAPGKLALEAEELAKEGGDFWLAGVTRLLPKGARNAGTAAPSELVEAIQRFSVTLSFREKLTADLKLHTATPKDAERLLGFYRLLEMQKSSSKDAELIANSVTAEQVASGLRFRLSVDPKELTPMVTERMKGLTQRGGGSNSTASAAPGGPKIVIQGLEEGPREIPLNGRR